MSNFYHPSVFVKNQRLSDIIRERLTYWSRNKLLILYTLKYICFTTCTAKVDAEGICVDYSNCNEDHVIEHGGIFDE